MVLLCPDVDSNIIKLIGCWRRDEMLRYLHVQAESLIRNFYQLMVTHGNYSFLLHQEDVPCF